MERCKRCGCEFEAVHARRSIGRQYGAGTYDDYYPEANVCEHCAVLEISADVGAGEEFPELMGSGWDD